MDVLRTSGHRPQGRLEQAHWKSEPGMPSCTGHPPWRRACTAGTLRTPRQLPSRTCWNLKIAPQDKIILKNTYKFF